jgi:Na+/H+ antiporter NhaD/arsenite permease-like protein
VREISEKKPISIKMDRKKLVFLVCLILTLILFFYQLSQFRSEVSPDWEVYRYQEIAFWIVLIADIIIIIGAMFGFLSSFNTVGSRLSVIAGVVAVITSLYLPFSPPIRNWIWYTQEDIFFELIIYILIFSSALYGNYLGSISYYRDGDDKS